MLPFLTYFQIDTEMRFQFVENCAQTPNIFIPKGYQLYSLCFMLYALIYTLLSLLY